MDCIPGRYSIKEIRKGVRLILAHDQAAENGAIGNKKSRSIYRRSRSCVLFRQIKETLSIIHS